MGGGFPHNTGYFPRYCTLTNSARSSAWCLTPDASCNPLLFIASTSTCRTVPGQVVLVRVQGTTVPTRIYPGNLLQYAPRSLQQFIQFCGGNDTGTNLNCSFG